MVLKVAPGFSFLLSIFIFSTSASADMLCARKRLPIGKEYNPRAVLTVSYLTKGTKCRKGFVALNQSAGVEGAPGAIGPVGPQGPIGLTGPQGATGEQGLQGLQGIQGIAGAVGATGAQGEVGPQGPAGAQGAAGAQGPQGLQGIQGVAGAVGATGAQGEVGPQGPTGAQGATGAQGPQGVAGPQGIQGAQGPAGQFSIKGCYPKTEATKNINSSELKIVCDNSDKEFVMSHAESIIENYGILSGTEFILDSNSRPIGMYFRASALKSQEAKYPYVVHTGTIFCCSGE